MNKQMQRNAMPCICKPTSKVFNAKKLPNTKQCLLCNTEYCFHTQCINQWWSNIPKSKKYPLVMKDFHSTNVGINRFYCPTCKTSKCPVCDEVHSSTAANSIVVLCKGDEQDTDHKCHWFISSKDCYKSNGKVLGPVDNWNCRQGIKEIEVEEKLNAEYISKFKSCRADVQNMSFMPKVLATADDEIKKMGLDLIMSAYLDQLMGLVNSIGADEVDGDMFNNEIQEAYCFIKALESDIPKTRQAGKGNILKHQFKNSKSGIPISDLS